MIGCSTIVGGCFHGGEIEPGTFHGSGARPSRPSPAPRESAGGPPSGNGGGNDSGGNAEPENPNDADSGANAPDRAEDSELALDSAQRLWAVA